MSAYKKMLVVLFITSVTLPALAAGKDRSRHQEPIARASELHQACAPPRTVTAGAAYKRRSGNPRCDRFLSGLLHTLQMAQRGYLFDQPAMGQLQLSRCIELPDGTISLAKLRDIITNFGERHAEMLHLPALEFATAALAAWFPCSPPQDDRVPPRFNQ